MTAPTPEPLEDRASAREGARAFFHGSAVELDGKGVLVLGPSGSGKSSLALALLGFGATLICDDGVWVDPPGAPDGPAMLRRPDGAPELIEARGIGLLKAGPVRAEAPLSLVVDLSRREPHRLPPSRLVTFGTARIVVILAMSNPMLTSGLVQLLRHGRADT